MIMTYNAWNPYEMKQVREYHFSKQKFAELIVRECAQFVGDKNSLAVKQMFEHFGINE